MISIYRYTSPHVGITIAVSITLVDNSILILIKLTDFCPGGLPDKVLHFLQNSFGPEKVIRQDSTSADRTRLLRHKGFGSRDFDSRRTILGDVKVSSGSWEEDDRVVRPKRSQRDISPSPITHERTRMAVPSGFIALSPPVPETPPVQLHSGKGRSSGTGLPHLVQLFDELTRSGDYFDVRISTWDMGTTVKIAFSGEVSAVKVDVEIDELNASIMSTLTCGKNLNIRV